MENKDIIAQLSRKLGRNRADVGKLMDGLTSVMTECCADLNSVSIPGFGTFESKHREARTGRNPRTKEAVEIPASTVPSFKAGKAFKDQVNG